mgnify:CR=1 FL=1
MNRAILIGRLTKDPELRYTQSGIAVASLTLAVDRPFKNQQGDKETDFIPVVVWRKAAENCAQYLSKGSMAGVEGRMQVRSYEAQDGSKRYVTEVVADNVQFLSTNKSQGQGQGQAEAPAASAPADGDYDFPF